LNGVAIVKTNGKILILFNNCTNGFLINIINGMIMMIIRYIFVFLLSLIDSIFFSLNIFSFRIEMRWKTLYSPCNIMIIIYWMDGRGGALKGKRDGPIIVADV
jgi:hypothetical protein